MKGVDKMNYREKVIGDLKKLEQFAAKNDMPGIQNTAHNAAELLKEQEARLLTRSEIQSLEEGQFVWIQTKADGLYHLEIIGICGTPGRYTDIQFNAPKIFPELNINRYMFGWTAWTVQPTKEQMERVKWE